MIYQEKMDKEELQFLLKKYRKDRTSFLNTFRSILLFFLLVPGAGGIFMEMYHRKNHPERYQPEDLQNAYFYLTYVVATIIIVILICLTAWWVYQRGLLQLVRDIKAGQKMIEQTVITRKTHFSSTNTFHFYLKSTRKLSIEVNGEDYNKFQEEDEINIEYAPHSGVYFGYF